jgi:DNA polymerase V
MVEFSERVGHKRLSKKHSFPLRLGFKEKNLDHSVASYPRALGLGTLSCLALPLYGSRVQAGFPSPSDDYIEGELDLNQHLIKHKDATFYVRAIGHSMLGAGIFPGDLLIVDRAITAKSGHIIIAVLNGELTVKRLIYRNSSVFLCPDNPEFSEIEIAQDHEFSIWGVVTTVVHPVL